MPEEPDVNISGGASGGGRETRFEADDPSTRAEAVVDRLGDLFWQKTYGDRDPFDCLVRTILSQNTSDVASQPAYDALVERFDPARGDGIDPDLAFAAGDDGPADLAEALATADRVAIAETIAPAGLHNQKSKVLQTVAERILAEYGSTAAFDDFVATADYADVRDALLDFGGVGPKTADCVLLFAAGRQGVFPVDTHVHRIYRRLGIAPPDADHEGVRAVLEREVPGEKCGFGHTASIQFGREYCSARKPACLDGPEACPLYDRCDRVGVDPESRAVVDPESRVVVDPADAAAATED
ncbi:HhH-GPD family protein [Salinarchaeum sp. Harcht-Bsk1]|uniref:endonuclease III domain-containing protein n=1 Tax=Salinarchaeum sp. Harcht-Bsk1 TaxID=1333523 RepID=UPI000342362F|nr:endonuclease III [Salinarchaeum sp. Harcht-Bsk1]AGN01821.1 HhH-GPD family protein [Salinarchaeum sp. Harcht-Bsk1]